MNDYEAKSRGYRVRESIDAGSAVTVTEPVRVSVRNGDDYDRFDINPGDVVHVVDYTNAGFRGIEATIQHADGRRSHGVQAGYLTQA